MAALARSKHDEFEGHSKLESVRFVGRLREMLLFSCVLTRERSRRLETGSHSMAPRVSSGRFSHLGELLFILHLLSRRRWRALCNHVSQHHGGARLCTGTIFMFFWPAGMRQDHCLCYQSIFHLIRYLLDLLPIANDRTPFCASKTVPSPAVKLPTQL